MFGDIPCMMTFAFIMTLVSAVLTLYFAAVLSGMYKDPLMATFRVYGDDPRPNPLSSFCLWAGILGLLMAMLLGSITPPGSYSQGLFPPVIFTVAGISSLIASYVTRRRPDLGQVVPRWYHTLLHVSTRQERRLIGFAWLRIPRKMRWRLNGDQAAFQSWVDTVRITVIYGAYDPNNPWTTWT